MSVLIKGMEMPKKCEQCWFFGTDSARVGYCYLLKGELPLPDGVPQDCPLIEVPPHGKLIDADALKNSLAFAENTAKWAVPALRAVLMVIDEMPTIIPPKDGEP